MWIDSLSELDRRTIVFIREYENIRQSKGQFGYKAFKEENVSIINKPMFKQFRTVVKWLDTLGWKISWHNHHWRGYISYAFEMIKPQIPAPGQLKNLYVLRKYISASPSSGPTPMKNDIDLDLLYKQVLRPEISSVSYRAILGLRNLPNMN